MVKVHVVGESGGGSGGDAVVAIRHWGWCRTAQRKISSLRLDTLWQPEDRMIEDQPKGSHTRMGRVLGSRVNLSMMANYNNAIVITAEGNLSATGPKTEGSLFATRPKSDELLFTQPTDHPNNC